MTQDHDIISMDDFAVALLASLTPILPSTIRGLSEGSVAGVTSGDGHFTGVDLAAGVGEPTLAVMAARADHFLDRVQDFVVETLCHGWPGVDGSTSGAAMPLPFTRVRRGRLELGYVRQDVRVQLAPIDLLERSADDQ